MATEDPEGDISWKGKRYRQVLQDYPYADDGMLIWDALHDWVSAYLKVSGPVQACSAMLPSVQTWMQGWHTGLFLV